MYTLGQQPSFNLPKMDSSEEANEDTAKAHLEAHGFVVFLADGDISIIYAPTESPEDMPDSSKLTAVAMVIDHSEVLGLTQEMRTLLGEVYRSESECWDGLVSNLHQCQYNVEDTNN